MRILFQVWTVLLILVPAARSDAVTITPFGDNGEGGSSNGQSSTIGSDGTVFEVDGFVNIGGRDLNGGGFGTSAQLSKDALPSGLDFTFDATLSSDSTDLTLSYSFTNNTASDLIDFQFLSFVDADIADMTFDSFWDESASTSGFLAEGQNFEVDEPGYMFGDIFDNVRLGTLDGDNAVPWDSPEDVAMALSFGLPVLGSGETYRVDIMLSEDGGFLGTFVIDQGDPNLATTISYSGTASVASPMPEPSSLILFGAGSLLVGRALRRRTVKESADSR